VVVVALAAVVGATLLGLLRRLAPPLVSWLARLDGRARAQRNREALAALRAVPLWSELSLPRLLEMARLMKAGDVAGGVDVVRQGEPADRFYLIVRGAFEVFVDGQPVVRLGRGEYFGEPDLLRRGAPAGTVIAVEPSRVFTLDQAGFDALLASDVSAREQLEAAQAYREQIASMPLFQDVSPAELDVLLSHMALLHVPAGESIVRRDELGPRFVAILAGSVEVLRDGELLGRLGPGEAFDQIAPLLDKPRTATVVALQPTQLLTLESNAFRHLLASYLGRGGEPQRLNHLRLRTHKRLDEIV